MKTSSIIRCATLVWLAGFLPAGAQVPGIITYQGRVTSHDTNFTGLGQFKFALVRPGLGTTTLWSQDGNDTPTTVIPVPVTNGLFTVALGDTSIAGMENPIPPEAFDSSIVRLRIWFNDGATGFAQLAPDQRLTSVGYAMRAANVPDGVITGAQLANGAVGSSDLADGAVITPKLANAAVTTAKLADDSVTPEKIPADSITGQKIAQNSLTSEDIADTLRLRDLQVESAGGLDRVQLTEVNNSGVLYMNHGTIGRFLEASGTTSGGFLRLFDAFGGIGLAQTTVELGSSSVGGYVRVLQDNKSTGVQINGQNGATPGGNILLYQGNGDIGVMLNGEGGGRIDSAGTINLMNSIGGNIWAQMQKNGSGGGAFRTLDELGNTTTFLASTATGGGGLLNVHMGNSIWPGVTLDGDDGNSGAILLKAANDSTRMVLDAYNGQGAEISLRHTNGVETVEIIASEGGVDGGQILMRNKSNRATVQIDGDASGNGSGYIRLYKGDGSVGLTLEGDASGQSKVTTQVLEITGGSDLSENFDIQTPDAKPGMIVSIDPAHPGELAVSARAYDRTVAGVVSGAGGVKPGLLMGQRNTKADGKHPVALTGRVYCFVDASAGAIEPGDLITTSATPGHGMKVSDHNRAQGAIIGKAMTGLVSGKGLVLVLVSLQ